MNGYTRDLGTEEKREGKRKKMAIGRERINKRKEKEKRVCPECNKHKTARGKAEWGSAEVNIERKMVGKTGGRVVKKKRERRETGTRGHRDIRDML